MNKYTFQIYQEIKGRDHHVGELTVEAHNFREADSKVDQWQQKNRGYVISQTYTVVPVEPKRRRFDVHL